MKLTPPAHATRSVLAGTNLWEPNFLFYAFRPQAQILLCVWLYGVNIFLFERFRVSHVFILQTSPAPETYLHATAVMLGASVWSVALLASFWFCVSNVWYGLCLGLMTTPRVGPWPSPSRALLLAPQIGTGSYRPVIIL